MTDAERIDIERLEHIIPYGKENAISRAELARQMNMPDRAMRKAVQIARTEGLLILNDGHGNGYYFSDNAEDLRRQLERTHRRALALLAQEKWLRRQITKVILGQTEMEI
ncbi:MAG: hypothetical protein IKU30_05785 [Clostridia bacterium]|nr:hypothetical protein [Clostridia bacterium]